METKSKWSFFNRVGRFIRGLFKKSDQEDQPSTRAVFPVRLRDISAIPPQPPPSIEGKKDY